jgi:hypothetical protein
MSQRRERSTEALDDILVRLGDLQHSDFELLQHRVDLYIYNGTEGAPEQCGIVGREELFFRCYVPVYQVRAPLQLLC